MRAYIKLFLPWVHASLLSLKGGENKPACMYAKTLQSCPTLCDPVDCNQPGSSIHGILQERILEWGVAMPFSRSSSWPRNQTSCLLHWQADSLPLTPPGKHKNKHVLRSKKKKATTIKTRTEMGNKWNRRAACRVVFDGCMGLFHFCEFLMIFMIELLKNPVSVPLWISAVEQGYTVHPLS